MSCYLPVLEKLKRRTQRDKSLNGRQRSSSVPNVLEDEEAYEVSCIEEDRYASNRKSGAPIPKRDSRGFTITQELGNFPHELSLNIRHNHPTLGLSDVAYQRIHQGHRMDPLQYEKLQCELQASSYGSRRMGVLSLGLPDQFNLFKKSRPNTPASLRGGHPEERPTMYEEFIESAKILTSTSSSSGHSSGSHSPSHQYSTPLEGSSPPPLAPKGLSLGPPPPIHRFSTRKDIADIHHEGPRGLEESSSASSSAAESDSIGSVRRSSPEISKPLESHHLHLLSKENRLSPRTELSKTLESRLSPSVYGGLHHLTPKMGLHHQNQLSDIGYHSMNNTSPAAGIIRGSTPTSSIEARSSPDPWDVRATKIPAHELKRARNILARSSPSYLSAHNQHHQHLHRPNPLGPSLSLDHLPDDLLIKVLSFLSSNDIVRLSRVNRRFYFCAWDPSLWTGIHLTGESTDADLGIKTILRLLSRNSAGNAKLAISKISMNGCRRLTDRGLAIVARRCPGLKELEIQYCINITNGGLMDLVSKCHLLDHLDVTGCQMISTISVHQPPPSPRTFSANIPLQPQRRQLNIQYLDLSDCVSLEDSGLKMVVESCPQLTYLFLRRCSNITDVGIKAVSSYCLCLRELSISDCLRVTDYSLFELAKLGPNLRYLSVAKCDRITDSGIKQLARLCYKLRYLNLRGCESISDTAVETISRSCTRLRSLDVGKCDISNEGLRLLAENCPNLKKLSIKSCEMVGDKGIQTVAYYCRGLQQLNIQDSPVTLDGYRAVKKFCRRCVIEHSHPGFY